MARHCDGAAHIPIIGMWPSCARAKSHISICRQDFSGLGPEKRHSSDGKYEPSERAALAAARSRGKFVVSRPGKAYHLPTKGPVGDPRKSRSSLMYSN